MIYEKSLKTFDKLILRGWGSVRSIDLDWTQLLATSDLSFASCFDGKNGCGEATFTDLGP